MFTYALKKGKLLLFAVSFCLLSFSIAAETKRPNFVFLISEDNAKHYVKLYNEDGAQMPNVESLAEQGLIFEHAFSNAPVCSTARTTLATGAYGPKIGTFFHRAFKQAQLPKGLLPFSQLLKNAGYYTTNNSKTDYNFVGLEQRWDMSSPQASWRERDKSQAFFHVQTFYKTHEGTLHFPLSDVIEKPTKHDPNKMKLAPIYPDTALFRYTQARYLDNHQIIDKEIGHVLQKLKQDGLMENTFIFYFGDHGGALPGSKGYAFDRGLHVPLIVRIPKNFQHLVGQGMKNPAATQVDGFVSFVDFAPTVLSLAGFPKNSHHDGTPFLGKNISLADVNKKQTTLGYADRFDEKLDMVRTIRQGNFKYMRNYQPFYHDSLFNVYRYKQQAFKEWKALYEEGKLNAEQSAFFEAKSPEALFDISVDPYETKNLANQPKYQATLKKLRKLLQNELKSLPDLGFYPEPEVINLALADPIMFGKSHQTEIAQLIDIADLQLLEFEKAKPQLIEALNSKKTWKKYWALISLSHFGEQAIPLKNIAHKLLTQPEHNLVKGRAIEFLARVDNLDPAPALTKVIAEADSNIERLALLNIAAFLHETQGAVFPRPKIDTWPQPIKGSDTYNADRNMDSWLGSRWDYVSGNLQHK